MIGVAVVAILTVGVLAAIFGVIPWSQDHAAKQDLASVNTAQGAAYAKDGKYLNRDGIITAGWLSTELPEPLVIDANTAGTCYVAVQEADTGRGFIVNHTDPAPRELTNQDTWCNGDTIDTNAVEAPERPAEPVAEVKPVMVTTWDTSLASRCPTIILPIRGNVDATIDWGDGSAPQTVTSNNPGHAYTAPHGPVVITIDGTFDKWNGVGAEWSDADCLVSVDSWGATGTASLHGAFAGADNLEHVEEIPSTTTILASAFYNSKANPTLGAWDTSNVTNMSSMFQGATAFNQPLNFDTSKVATMTGMFFQAASFNQPLSFDTSNVINMTEMFRYANSFNQDLSGWDVSNVTVRSSFSQNTPSWYLPKPSFK